MSKTTTSSYQYYPDYFNSNEECKEFDKNYNKKQNNKRYKNFKQTHFTAGDEEQFYKYKSNKNGMQSNININENNLFFECKLFERWDKYKELNVKDINNTFKYIFEKFKKGIYVKILNNKLEVFLPFSNVNFINEWSENIKIDSKYKDINEFFRYITENEGYKYNKNHINSYINTWYSNNCLLRYEFPINEGDTNIPTIKNMLEELCEKRQVPDIEFFINRRDYPLLSKNGYEPYYHLWDSKEYPLVSHNYDKYLPILSMSSSNEYADILSPTYEDWVRVQNKENKWFSKSRQNYEDNIFNIPWNEKKNTAVFRGSSTGEGVDIKTNQRLHLAYLSSITPKDENGIAYIDAGITKWTNRVKKIMGEKYLKFIDKRTLPFNLVEKLSPLEQSSYKYIIHVDGNVTALRLSYELSLNSVILIVKSEWKIWFSELLQPYIHYIPIKEDLSDLLEKIKWCRMNDKECENIASNAKEFYNKYLQKDGILDYYQKLLIEMKKETGVYFYNTINNLDIILESEKNILFDEKILEYPLTNKNIKHINIIPNIKRTYGKLKAIRWIINMIIKNKSIDKELREEKIIFDNKLGTVKKYELNNFEFAVKITDDENKMKEHIHEAFIGLNGINNLIKYIPNFVYTFGVFNDDRNVNIIMEYIHGKTLQEYILSENFKFYEFLHIILQICLALNVAQQRCNFVHYDLTPWNILLKYLDEPEYFSYIVEGKVIRIRSYIVPIIIDYGKSHIIYNDKHHGFIKMYNFSKSFDVLSIFITSIYQIIVSKYLPSNDFMNLLKIANFISKTKYCPNKFKNIKEMKIFFHNAKKYSNLVNSEKYELDKITPMDLFNYIIENTNYKFPHDYSLNYYIVGSDSKQIFDYILSKDVNEKINSYINAFNDIKNIDLSNIDNDISIIYILQNLENNLISMMDDLINFLEIENISKYKYENIFNETMEYLKSMYKKKYKKLLLKDFENMEEIEKYLKIENYDDNIFLYPKKIKEYLNKFSDIENINIDKYINIKNILELIVYHDGIFKISVKNKNRYMNILKINTSEIKNAKANIKTLKEHSKIIYENNIREIEKNDISDKYLNEIKNIIKI